MPAKLKPTSFMPFWKTNKKPTDYSVLKVFRMYQQICITESQNVRVCALSLTHTILPTYGRREMCQWIFKYTGATCKCMALASTDAVSYAVTPVPLYRLTHTYTCVSHHVVPICLQYPITDIQSSTKRFYVFLSCEVISSSIILYMARITEIFADLGLYLHTVMNNFSTGFMFH